MGGKILYAETRGDGAPLVLISGGGGDAGMYEDAAPLLAARAFAAFGSMTMPDPPWLFRSPTGQAIVAAGSRAMADRLGTVLEDLCHAQG